MIYKLSKYPAISVDKSDLTIHNGLDSGRVGGNGVGVLESSSPPRMGTAAADGAPAAAADLAEAGRAAGTATTIFGSQYAGDSTGEERRLLPAEWHVGLAE